METDKRDLQPPQEKFQAEDGHQNPAAFRSYLERLFCGVDLKDRRVLEIGSGRGLISQHCGLAGAAKVVSIEPELDGSTSGVIATQKRRIDELGLKNIELRRVDFNTTDFGDRSFDVVVMIAVLNHLYETSVDARKDDAVFNKYVEIAKKIHSLLDDGGVVIATDACRYCLWTQLRRIGYPKRWCMFQRTINWKIHQQPSVWKQIFNAAGFSRFEVTYPVPYRLRSAELIVGTPLINFALMGEFVFYAQKEK